MRTKPFLHVFLCLILLVLSETAQGDGGFLSVSGPCHLRFPRDHGAHPGYRTEWWYYTGNLKNRAGNRFGFQLTFFRSQISPPGEKNTWPKPSSAWRTEQIYLGHAAISDMSKNRHFQAESVSRQALGMAGVRQTRTDTIVFIHNWRAAIVPGRHHLSMSADEFSYALEMRPVKPPVLHGTAGYSKKGAGPEHASCYYSFTRLAASGTMTVGGDEQPVEGSGWMDHEFSTAPLEPGISGWDWFSLQFSDQTEVMVYLLRKTDGTLSSASSGTVIGTSGESHHLTLADISMAKEADWQSPNSGAVYPARWRMTVVPFSLDVTIVPNMANQEMQTPMSTGVTYWEGSVSVKGTKRGLPIQGVGYVELTGYANPMAAPM